GRHRAAPDPRDVVLECTRQLVADDEIGLLQARAHRKDDAAFEALRDTTRALARRFAQYVRLLEVGMIGVENQRLPARQLMAQPKGQTRIPAPRHAARAGPGPRFVSREAEDAVLAAQDLDVESHVLDKVATD